MGLVLDMNPLQRTKQDREIELDKWNYADGGESPAESKVVQTLQLGVPTYV